MQEKFSDTDIREALRRHFAAMPPLSDDFNDKLFAALNRKKRQRKMRRLIIWPSIAAAATVALLLTLLPVSEPQHNAVIAQVQPKVVNQSPVAAHPEDSVEPAPVVVSHKVEKKTYRHSEPATQEIVPAEPELAPVAEEEPVVEEQFSRSRMEYVAANRDNMRSRIRKEFDTPSLTMNSQNHEYENT